MRLITFLMWALAQLVILAQAQAQPACPSPPSSISGGNAAALSLFHQLVVQPDQVGTPPKSRPPDMVAAEGLGAKGDGVADDSRALQAGLSKGEKVWLQSGRIYRITRRLELGSGSGLASDGTATILMSSAIGAFDNAVGKRGESGVLSERGTGMRVRGKDVTISDIFLVKEYADGRYAVGIDVVAASNVAIRRVRLRGFSLAPGIITVRSSDNVEVASSLIHGSCTQWRELPPDIPAFQVTGINVDDTRVGNRGSTAIKLRNNVIADMRMMPGSKRGEQSDGINFSGSGTGHGSSILDNHIQDVDEGLDLFGAGIEVRGNRIAASSRVVKLIHGARNIVLSGNDFTPGPNAYGIGIFKARPPEAKRQVKAIRIEGNRFHLINSRQPGVFVDNEGEFAPSDIVIRQNKFYLSQCRREAVQCSQMQCAAANNDKYQSSDRSPCRE